MLGRVRVGDNEGVWEDELAVAGVRIGCDLWVWVEELAVAGEMEVSGCCRMGGFEKGPIQSA